jgi:hypothetical protein
LAAEPGNRDLQRVRGIRAGVVAPRSVDEVVECDAAWGAEGQRRQDRPFPDAADVQAHAVVADAQRTEHPDFQHRPRRLHRAISRCITRMPPLY